MNSLDLILLIPIGLGFIFGLSKGLIKELASLAVIVIGIYGARLLSPMVSDFLIKKFDFSSKTSQPIAFLLIFLIIGIGLFFLTRILDKIFETMYMGGLNKLLGGLFGGLKFALIVSVLLNIFNALDSRINILNAETKENSIGYTPLMKMGPTLWDSVKQTRTEKSHLSPDQKVSKNK